MRSIISFGVAFLFIAQLDSLGLAQSGIITTYAGANAEMATSQTIDGTVSAAPDGSGGFYVASTAQNRVYGVTADGRITPAVGNGTQGFSGDGGMAVSAQLNGPWGIAVDAAGNLFVADARNHRIRKVTPGGVISTVAGNGTAGFGGDGGPATSAQLNAPWDVAVDATGVLYIADTGNACIRKVTSDGVISTVAGNGTSGFSGDGGAATSAQLAGPSGVAVDVAGNLFIADTANQRIRKVTATGVINTLAGNGVHGFSGDGGPATAAQFNAPWDVAVDTTGNLFIADTWNHRVRKVTASGLISTVAGNGTSGFSGDGGPATSAQLNQPTSVAVDTAGGLLIADAGNSRVRKVSSGGVINTVAGGGVAGFTGDSGPAISAKLNGPIDVAVDSRGNLFIADYYNRRIRKVTPDGIISTVAGGGAGSLGDGGPATSATLNNAVGVTVDTAGNLFIAQDWSNRVRKVTPGGIISTVAGNGAAGFGGDGGPATSAMLDFPTAVAVDAAGNLFIADSDNRRIRKVTPGGIISTMAGGGNNGLGDGGPATSAKLNTPVAIAVDAAGNLFIADSADSRVRRVAPSGVISTVAGNGIHGFSGDGDLATSAELNRPGGVTVDEAGNLFIADTYNERVRKVTPVGVISTVAGNGTSGFSGDGGLATSAQLDRPAGVAVDTEGSLFIADFNNSRVRKVNLEASATTFFPQVAIGGGYSTLFTVTNTGSDSATGILSLTDQQGNPFLVSVTLTDSFGTTQSPLPGNTFDFTVPAGGTIFLLATDLSAGGSAKNGWAQLDSAGGSLAAAATYERVANGSIQTMVGVLQSPPLQFATIPVNNDTAQDCQIAYAIGNPSDQTISIKLALVSQNGAVIDDTVTVTLGPGQQMARYLWQDLARTNFKGSLVLRAQGGASFIAVALVDKQGLLTVIPLVSGKAPGIPD